MSTGEDLVGRSIAAHRVNGDRQHQGGFTAQPTSTATRSLYQPHAGHTVCGSLAAAQRGQMLRAGAPSFHAPARWLRVFIFDFFFLGTAIWTPGGASQPRRSRTKSGARRLTAKHAPPLPAGA